MEGGEEGICDVHALTYMHMNTCTCTYMCTHQVLVGVSQSGLEGSGQLPQGGLDELGLRDDFLDLR